MSRIKLSRREWALFLFPCALLLLTNLNRFPGVNMDRVGLALNPFARATGNRRLSSCQSNLKQLGLGIQQYIQDADGKYPLNTTPTQNWVHLIFPYTKNCPILHCVSDPSFAGQMIPSYWMNANLNDTRGMGLSYEMIDHPARTFLFGDWESGVAKSPFVLNEKAWSSQSSYADRHLFGANYLFNDGHAKWLSSDDVNALKSRSSNSSPYSWQIQ